MNTEVHLVSLGPANTPSDLSMALLRQLSDCELIFYPGDWVNEALRETFGAKLRWGRTLRTEDILHAARDLKARGCSMAVLYNGDGRLFTGRHDVFAPCGDMARHLTDAGFEVRSWPGVTAVSAAIDAAGWQILAQPWTGLLTVAPLCLGPEGAEALRHAAQCRAVLALLWCEEHAELAYPILMEERGPETPIAIAQRIGAPDQVITQGPLRGLRSTLETLTPPAVILIAQPWHKGSVSYLGPCHVEI